MEENPCLVLETQLTPTSAEAIWPIREHFLSYYNFQLHSKCVSLYPHTGIALMPHQNNFFLVTETLQKLTTGKNTENMTNGVPRPN